MQPTDSTRQSRQTDNGMLHTRVLAPAPPVGEGATLTFDQPSYKVHESMLNAHESHITDKISCAFSADPTTTADQDLSSFSADPETESTTSSYRNQEYGSDSEPEIEAQYDLPTLSGFSFYDFIAAILKNFPRRARQNRNARKTEAVTHHDKCGSDPAHAHCTPFQRRQKVYTGKNWQHTVLLPDMHDTANEPSDQDNDIVAEARSEKQYQRKRSTQEFKQRWEMSRPRRTTRTSTTEDFSTRLTNPNQDQDEYPILVAGPVSQEEWQRAQLKATLQGRGYGASVDWMQQEIANLDIQNVVVVNTESEAPANQTHRTIARSDRLDPHARRAVGTRLAILCKGHWSLIHIGAHGWTHSDPLTKSQAGLARHEHLENYFGRWMQPRFTATQPRGTTQCGHFVFLWLLQNASGKNLATITLKDTIRLRAMLGESTGSQTPTYSDRLDPYVWNSMGEGKPAGSKGEELDEAFKSPTEPKATHTTSASNKFTTSTIRIRRGRPPHRTVYPNGRGTRRRDVVRTV